MHLVAELRGIIEYFAILIGLVHTQMFLMRDVYGCYISFLTLQM